MAVQQPRPRVGGMVPHHDPARVVLGGQRRKGVAPRRVDEVELARDLLDGLGDAAPPEGALAGADVVHFRAVLVDRVRRLREHGRDEDEVDPVVEVGRDGHVVL